MPPESADHGRQHPLPPASLMPAVQIVVEVRRLGGLSDEHAQAEVAAGLIEEAIDEAGLLFGAERLLPQLVEVAAFQDAARSEVSAGEGIADAEAEEIVLKPGSLADETRAVGRRPRLQVEVHIGVAGAKLDWDLEPMQSLGRGERAIEVVVDLLESRDDRAAECGDAVEDEQVRIATWREPVVEVNIDPLVS